MTPSNQPVELYSYWRSSSAYRVRCALAIKGIAYSYRAVNLLAGEQATESYGQLNPMHFVPTLYIDGHHLGQSMAIIEYLEETRPSPALLPKDPYRRHVVRQLAQIIIADTQPVQNPRVLKRVSTDQAVRNDWAKWAIAEGLKAFEALLAKTAGKYCVGDELSFADCVLVPQMYNARRYQVDLAPFPTVVRVDATLNELPAFKQAHPNEQPDAEKP